MRSTPLWSAVFLASSASAQTGNPGLPKIGPLKPGIGNTPEALQVSEDAGRKPNDTDLVAFTRMFNGTEEEWTWGINITSFRVPNRIEDLGAPHANDSNGWYITNIQWQLGWPGDKGDSLQGYLADRNMSASFGAMISNKFPGLTEDYHADDNGDCTALLGDDCVRSLAKSASRGDTVQFDSLDGCEDTLDAHGDGDIQSGTAWSQPLSQQTRSPMTDPMITCCTVTALCSTAPQTLMEIIPLHMLKP
ncbi:hypothetical protein DDE83_000115 [Stemphylium lycopersici]|uniref:Uncharacterized protein n=1 Tax=Stemphylium lycopersici TaxID=183478 RepID=A0A364NH02_STELY|nr:hypothetical protein DDE83_000115 [Stemphylium lycopersici]